MVETWIDAAVEAAKRQPWFDCLREKAVRRDLEAWGEDGMFRTEQQVRDRLCQYAQQQIAQIGRANFTCTL